MKAMFTGFGLALAIMVGAFFGLQEIGFSSAERNSGGAVRLD